MDSITLGIGLAAGALIFLMSPKYSLIVYVAVMTWYPGYLTVKLGTVDFSVSRILILAIYIKLFLFTDLPKRFKFCGLDTFVIIFYLCQLLAGILTTPIAILLENRAGAVFDRVLPYFAIRMIIRTKENYIWLLKGILCVVAPMAIVSFSESLTGFNPYGYMENFRAWQIRELIEQMRLGLHRARASFSHAIMLGLFFAMLGPICLGLLGKLKKEKMLSRMGIALMGLGVLSSLSSGPFLAVIVAVAFIAFYRYKQYWKPVLITMVFLCLLVEIVSNRHFYDVLGGFTFSNRTAWYRSRLIDVALFEDGMSGHWITGYGLFVDPGWGPLLDQRAHTDMVNHYLKVLCQFGLIGFVPFVAMITTALRTLVRTFRYRLKESDRWLIWCLLGAFVGLLCSLISVSLYAQSITIFYIMLGFSGTMPAIMGQRATLLSSNQVKVSKYINKAQINYDQEYHNGKDGFSYLNQEQ